MLYAGVLSKLCLVPRFIVLCNSEVVLIEKDFCLCVKYY